MTPKTFIFSTNTESRSIKIWVKSANGKIERAFTTNEALALDQNGTYVIIYDSHCEYRIKQIPGLAAFMGNLADILSSLKKDGLSNQLEYSNLARTIIGVYPISETLKKEIKNHSDHIEYLEKLPCILNKNIVEFNAEKSLELKNILVDLWGAEYKMIFWGPSIWTFFIFLTFILVGVGCYIIF